MAWSDLVALHGERCGGRASTEAKSSATRWAAADEAGGKAVTLGVSIARRTVTDVTKRRSGSRAALLAIAAG
jgi:hypothetical protein